MLRRALMSEKLSKLATTSTGSPGIEVCCSDAGRESTTATFLSLVLEEAAGVREEGFESSIAIGPVAEGTALAGQE
jgi:hypothetical protein